jgi:hypothetical protein
MLLGYECPEPFIPDPSGICWDKITPSPYTMVIKSDKYGDFNFTKDAENDFEKFKGICRKYNYSLELPAVALFDVKQDITSVILPPEDKILFLNIDTEKIYSVNTENTGLIAEFQRYSIDSNRIDSAIEKIIANAIHHPLGRFCLGRKNKDIVILAEVLDQKIYIPLECVKVPLADLMQKTFSKEEINETDFLIEKIKPLYSSDFTESKEFQLRKDWYVVSTPNACYWTEYFTNYINRNIGEGKQKIPIHLHPWAQMEWLLETPEKYWISELEYHLLPSSKDIEFFKSRYPEAKIYIILGKDLYSDELNWAVYDDISAVEKDIAEIELLGTDKEKIKKTIAEIKNKRGLVQRYYLKKEKGLFVDEMIDALLMLNKRQAKVLKNIEAYKNARSWRLLNTDYLLPILNRALEKKSWKVSASSEDGLICSMERKEFCYKKNETERMDLFLFVLERLRALEANNLAEAVHNKAEIFEFLNNLCPQLDYLCVQYGHLEEFANHLGYLSEVIRLYIWNFEKGVLVSKEQLKNGRTYLSMYNLGYYKGVSDDDLKIIAEAQFKNSLGIIDIEGIIKELSKKYSIKNIEEFIMEFEKELIVKILDVVK